MGYLFRQADCRPATLLSSLVYLDMLRFDWDERKNRGEKSAWRRMAARSHGLFKNVDHYLDGSDRLDK